MGEKCCGSPVLPHNSIANRFPCTPFPNHRCFPLISDSNTSDLIHGDVGLGDCLSHSTTLCTPDFFGIMLHPPGLGKNLLEFFLSNTDNVSLFVKHHAAAAGGALVKCKNVAIRHARQLKVGGS